MAGNGGTVGKPPQGNGQRSGQTYRGSSGDTSNLDFEGNPEPAAIALGKIYSNK